MRKYIRNCNYIEILINNTYVINRFLNRINLRKKIYIYGGKYVFILLLLLFLHLLLLLLYSTAPFLFFLNYIITFIKYVGCY